jgi:hypothetical protein
MLSKIGKRDDAARERKKNNKESPPNLVTSCSLFKERNPYM